MNGKRAFSFAGRAAQALMRAGVSAAGKMNVVLMAVDAGVAVVEAAGAYVRYRQEKEITEQVRRQVAALQEALDMQVAELRARIEVEVAEMHKRILLQLHMEESELKANLVWLQAQAESQAKKAQQTHAEWMKSLQIEERARRPLRQAMETVSRLIMEGRAQGREFAELAPLEEEYRHCAIQYDKMIESTLRRNEA